MLPITHFAFSNTYTKPVNFDQTGPYSHIIIPAMGSNLNTNICANHAVVFHGYYFDFGEATWVMPYEQDHFADKNLWWWYPSEKVGPPNCFELVFVFQPFGVFEEQPHFYHADGFILVQVVPVRLYKEAGTVTTVLKKSFNDVNKVDTYHQWARASCWDGTGLGPEHDRVTWRLYNDYSYDLNRTSYAMWDQFSVTQRELRKDLTIVPLSNDFAVDPTENLEILESYPEIISGAKEVSDVWDSGPAYFWSLWYPGGPPYHIYFSVWWALIGTNYTNATWESAFMTAGVDQIFLLYPSYEMDPVALQRPNIVSDFGDDLWEINCPTIPKSIHRTQTVDFKKLRVALPPSDDKEEDESFEIVEEKHCVTPKS